MRGTGRKYQRGDIWWIEFWHKGKQYRESTGLRGEKNARIAERMLRAKIAEVTSGDFQAKSKVTVNQVLDDFEKSYSLEGRQLKKLQSHLKPVRALLGDIKAEDLTERRIDDYINKRLAHVQKSTINRETQPLGQALRLAQSRQYIKRVPKIRKFAETNIRQGFFTYEQVVALVRHLPPYLHDFVWFAYYCGWRKGEISKLEWRDVDLHERVIRLRAEVSKNAEGRVLPLEGPLSDLIERRHALAHGPFVFHREGKPIGDFRKAWVRACTKAKVKFIFHDFRRTAAREMVRAKVPEGIVMDIIGHKTRSMLDRYNIIDDTDRRNALRKTDEFRRTRTEPAQRPESEEG